MSLTLLSLPALAAIMLAAHFVRSGELIGVAAAIAALVLLAVPRPWAARVVQLGLVAGAAEWLRTLSGFVAARVALGQPTLRLTFILLAVALFTVLAAAVFQQSALKRRYGLRS